MLTYEEANKLIVGYSKYYQTEFTRDDSTQNGYNWFSVYYKVPSVCFKQKEVAAISTERRFNMVNSMYNIEDFSKLPCYDELWMTLSELAMTPLDKRNGHKFNVVVGKCDVDYYSKMPRSYVVWTKSPLHDDYFCLSLVNYVDLDEDNVTFSESEYESLIEYIKKMPDGNTQAKIAELGKQAVVL